MRGGPVLARVGLIEAHLSQDRPGRSPFVTNGSSYGPYD